MSIVVAVSKGERTVMAADTQTSFGHEVLPPDNLTTTKVQRIGDALLGRTGWGIYDNILSDVLARGQPVPTLDDSSGIFGFFTQLWKVMHQRYAFVNDQSKRKDGPFGDLGGSFLVANAHGIFYVAPNLGVTRFEKYYAIGTGADYSLGAMHQLYDREQDPERIARSAVSTAITFNINCGGSVEVLEVP